MNAYYEEGATHNDHHKEMNIQVVGSLSTDAIEKLIAGFMGDETCHGTAQEVQTTDFCPSDVPEEQTLSKNGEASANDDSMPRGVFDGESQGRIPRFAADRLARCGLPTHRAVVG